MDNIKLAETIKQFREQKGLSQEELATLADLPHRQTVGQIENSAREVKAWELFKIANALGVELSSLFAKEKAKPQPYILWRQEPESDRVSLENQFIKNISTWRFLEDLLERKAAPAATLPSWEADIEKIGYRDVYEFAEKTRDSLDLGRQPASSLRKVLENNCNIKVLFEDLTGRGSAASSKSEHGLAILMNLREPPWRRNFSFAHELFHLLTWSECLLESIKKKPELNDRNESYADSFAAALLMPAESLLNAFNELINDDKISYSDLILLSRQFEVSTTALLWRLKYLGRLSSATVGEILRDPTFKAIDKQDMPARWDEPERLSSRFVQLAYQAFEKGKLSRAKLARILAVPLVDLPEELLKYGFAEAEDNAIKISNSRR